jgi:nucleoside-diphosphate-sugar epimerase
MKPICAVTGSSGYLGMALSAYLKASGWEVLELVRKPGPNQSKFQLGQEVSPDLLAGVQALVHCAYDFRQLSWSEIESVNVQGTRKLLQAAKSADVQKIVTVSTISAFPGCRSLYGKAKLQIEQITTEFGGLAIRPGLIYGKSSGGMFGKLSGQIARSKIVPVVGDGSQIQYLVHVDDLSSLIDSYLRDQIEFTNQVITAAHPEPWPFMRLLKQIARQLGKSPTFACIPWRIVWAVIKLAELAGFRLDFRSDSLVSLMYQNPDPNFGGYPPGPQLFRPFKEFG